MNRQFVTLTLALTAMIWLSGCVASIGNGGARHGGGTVGQQLIDLQKAKEAGALTDAEYQTEKARLLSH